MKKLLVSLFILISLMSLDLYCVCPTPWVEDDIIFYYGIDCRATFHHKYRLNENCEVEMQILYWSFLSGDEACEHLIHYPTIDFINSMYKKSYEIAFEMLGIELCDDPHPQNMYYFTSTQYLCTYLSSNGWAMYWPKNCYPSAACIHKYKLCLGHNEYGDLEVQKTLVESTLIGSEYCSKLINPNIIVWYDSNGNEIIGDPWNTTLHPPGPGGTPSPTIAWPITTDCYNFHGCDDFGF